MAKLNNTISLEHEVGTLWPLCECQAMTGSRGTKIQMERDDGGCICLIDTATYCECHEQLVRGRTHSWPLRASLICVEMSQRHSGGHDTAPPHEHQDHGRGRSRSSLEEVMGLACCSHWCTLDPFLLSFCFLTQKNLYSMFLNT